MQLAFGWNNAAAQKNATAVSFVYDEVKTYDVTCEWVKVTGGPKSKTVHHDITISAAHEPVQQYRQRVLDANGLISLHFQGAYRNPTGRAVELELRKVF
ncbi:hypothetical protein [Tsuneonella deserti]|uniref:hypothetical protein n=1 Tax=Tsuneonella deserti TaxID=2035528 RepID=UPI001663227E|nr:hypothetical protein [Tsuneonella deserti]